MRTVLACPPERKRKRERQILLDKRHTYGWCPDCKEFRNLIDENIEWECCVCYELVLYPFKIEGFCTSCNDNVCHCEVAID